MVIFLCIHLKTKHKVEQFYHYIHSREVLTKSGQGSGSGLSGLNYGRGSKD
jgi:hypothetical protein